MSGREHDRQAKVESGRFSALPTVMGGEAQTVMIMLLISFGLEIRKNNRRTGR